MNVRGQLRYDVLITSQVDIMILEREELCPIYSATSILLVPNVTLHSIGTEQTFTKQSCNYFCFKFFPGQNSCQGLYGTEL